jgi:hypothetical protein
MTKAQEGELLKVACALEGDEARGGEGDQNKRHLDKP